MPERLNTLDDFRASKLRFAVTQSLRFLRDDLPKFVPSPQLLHLDIAGRDLVIATLEYALEVSAESFVELDKYVAQITETEKDKPKC